METRKENILLKKSEVFATRIVKLYQYLINEKHETVISKQIYRSGTSIGANVAESEHAQSGIDFTHKLSISLKEANETRYWLNTLHNSNYIDDTGFNSMKEDVEELIRILVSSIKTMKRKNDPAISIQ
ncbi:MAG: four helix bundle protein [Prevotella sp.]|nr:four helix bundle protein [Prevotella sp.]MBQ6658604.1 four helix bundle protein [Prevotella sp.]MBQ7715901.1 four helix bundle protein [Prevotella sp.]